MPKKIKITINNNKYDCLEGQTILDVCLKNNIHIPHLCKHPDLSIKGNCRTCVVEVKGKGVVTSCSTQVENKMQVFTHSDKAEKIRKTNLELIFAEHIEKCPTCIYQDNCALLNYAKNYNLDIKQFTERKNKHPIWQFGNAIQFDSSKCIHCRNCEEVCRLKQGCAFYEIAERGVETVVKPKGTTGKNKNQGVDLLKNDPDKFDCTYCGQCIVHCPVGAISGVPHWPQVEKNLRNKKDKIMVAQIAPSIRVSIGEEFGLEPGQIVTNQLATAIKKLGFDHAFDVTLGADITTFEEALELIEWIKNNKQRPMFTSCCPAWVKFVEFYYPEFIDNLTTTRSPQIISGMITKSFFADKHKINPEKIEVVSIMPCTAKKHEAKPENHQLNLSWCLERINQKNISQACKTRTKFKNKQVATVDHVLTTREFAHMLNRKNINLADLKSSKFDSPLQEHSGAGVIYGTTGGVMESALRTADFLLRQKNPKLPHSKILKANSKQKNLSNTKLEFKPVRGMQEIKTAKLNLAGTKINVGVVHGLQNAKILLEKIKNKQIKLDYVEVMACPGGCIGGGGQPVPTNSALRKKRAQSLYQIDKQMNIRSAHQNPTLKKIYTDYVQDDNQLREELFHSGFKVKKRQGYTQIN